MTSSAIVAGVWPTKVMVQCRNEPPFEATVRFQLIPTSGDKVTGLTAYIDCIHCHRGYYLNPDGQWFSDRPLQVIPQA